MKTEQAPSATVDDDDIDSAVKMILGYKESITATEFQRVRNIVKELISQALRGSYKREDMIVFLMKYSGLLNPSNRIAKERVSKWLDQYDTERGKSNGN